MTNGDRYIFPKGDYYSVNEVSIVVKTARHGDTLGHVIANNVDCIVGNNSNVQKNGNDNRKS